jgi:hypothetical protein
MSLSLSVCLIACHGGPADHFATYAQELKKKGYDVHIHATGPALKKFQERGIEVKSPFSLDDLSPDDEDQLAKSIAKTCSTSSVIITDVGHTFDIKIQKALNIYAQASRHFAYYDNPEPFVPGGYSSVAAEVIKVTANVLFANATLAKAKIYSSAGQEVDFTEKKRFGIGYYPVTQAEKLAEKRKTDHEAVRTAFLKQDGLADQAQKVFVYFGGNNEEYFLKAFPAFLSLVAEVSAHLKNTVIVIQQHPGAKAKNLDGQKVASWLNEFVEKAELPKVVVSDFSSDQAQILADAAFYYQTSMGPQFVLGGIPAIQIGHETYEDILVRNHLAPSVTTAEGFIQAIDNLDKKSQTPQKDLLNSLGISQDWLQALEDGFKEAL